MAKNHEIEDLNGPLFETKTSKHKKTHRLFATTVLVSIILIWVYRAIHPPPSSAAAGSWIWRGMFAAELWFGLYWVLTQSVRWNPTYRRTFKHRLAHRFEHDLPAVDVFVCTADAALEPPWMVVNTVLSVMAYDYPPEKLAVYLSDDGGSDLTFYALTEAALFSKHWLPFCRNQKIEPRSPAAYFESESRNSGQEKVKDFVLIQRFFENMRNRIEHVTKIGGITEEIRLEHEGFSEWDSFTSPVDHGAVIQILIDGKSSEAQDVEGCCLPTLVYLAREKRPHHFHNFKAGAMNALIRVSSVISNGSIILNVDCDMYSNSSGSVRDALCFLMDEEKGHEIAFVQYPQVFENVTENEVYGGSLRVLREVDFHGLDGVGGPLYVGTGCFHRRATLLGEKFGGPNKTERKTDNVREDPTENVHKRLKDLAGCAFETGTRWGNEIGLKYGCPVEDVITGLSIHCGGWKSVFYNPGPRSGFLGVAATTMEQTLVQHKRWSEGDLLILVSKYSPVWYGLGRVGPAHLMGYLIYCLWAPSSLATLYYAVVPSLCLLNGNSLFPPVSSAWFVPYAYIVVSAAASDAAEFLRSGGTARGWWNDRRIWLYKRTGSYLSALTDTLLATLRLGRRPSFVISPKSAAVDPDVARRYAEEMMEFGAASPLFTAPTTVATINLLCTLGVAAKLLAAVEGGAVAAWGGTMAVQAAVCGGIVAINWPLYMAMFVRRDRGRMPGSVTVKSASLAVFACTCFSLLI